MRNRLLATICTCLLGILTVACGGGSSSAPSNPPGSGGASGGPRLAWDQFAPSADELRRYSYVLYVDGPAVPLPGAACGTLAPDTLTAACTAPLPAMNAGQHTLEMATRVTENGVVLESARSAPITYTVGPTGFASGSAGATAAIPGAGTGSPSGDTSSGAGQATGESGFIVETVVNGLDRPSGLARLPDGRLLVAERGGRIRMVDAGVLLEAPAAELANADAGADESVSLAVAPDFASTRHVYVGYVARDAEGARIGRVVGLREVGGTLGEAAVLVDDLPVQSGAPRVRIGPDGALYVGTDALDPEGADDLGSYAGKILRFTMQGNVPPDNPFGSSPVFSAGHRGRVDFDWDPDTRVMWHVEANPGGVSLGRQDGAQRSERVAYFEGVQTAAAAFHTAVAPVEWRGSLFLASPDQECLYRVTGLSASPVQPAIERLFANSYGRIVAVVAGDDGLYFAAGNGAVNTRGEPAGAVYKVR